jgi:hypothetical protein
MGDQQNRHSLHHPDRLPTVFARFESLGLGENERIVKYLRGTLEADPVLPQIALGLRLVPLK